MTTAEKQVIDILMADEVDYKKIAIEMAKNYPEQFLACFANKVMTDEEKLVIPHIKAGSKITAIKELRAYRLVHGGDTGLKPCKDFVDDVSCKLGN